MNRKSIRFTLFRIFVIALIIPCIVLPVLAAAPGSSGSGTLNVTNTEGNSFALSYSWTSAYIKNSGLQHSTTNGDADVVPNDANGTITIKARNSTYQKSGWIADSAQDVRTYCTLTNGTTYTLRITYSLSDNITRPDGVNQSGTIELSPNDSFPSGGTGFYVTKDVAYTSTDTNYEIGTITITAIEKVENASLSLYSSSFGSYTYQVGSTTATMAKGGDTYTNASVQVGSTIKLTATVDSAYADTYAFYGWMSDGSLLSNNATYSFPMGRNASIYPVFLPKDVANAKGTFTVNGTPYMFWHQAFAAASSAGKPVILSIDSYTLPTTMEENGLNSSVSASVYSSYLSINSSSVTYTVPSGLKLLIPFSSSDTGSFGSEPTNYISESDSCAMFDKGGIAARNFAHVTLKVPTGVKIDCFGQINVNGQRQNDGQPYSGVTLGGYGKIELNGIADEEQIVINNGAKLYCYGYITGNGMVNILGGGTIHELIQVCDWPGGTNATNWNKAATANQSMFPLSQYYIQNVEAVLKLNSGASAYAEAVLTASGSSQTVSSAYVGTSNGLFMLKDGAYVIRRYDVQDDRMDYHAYGTIDFGYLEIKKTFMGLEIINLNSSNYILPLSNNMSITIESGAVFNLSKQVAIMPGAELNIANGGTMNLSGQIYVFDVKDWTKTYFFNRVSMTTTSGGPADSTSKTSNQNPRFAPLPYVATLDNISPRATQLVRGSTVDANNGSIAQRYYMDAVDCTVSGKLVVNGTLNVSGAICTTNGNSSANKVVTGKGIIMYTATPNAGTLKGGYSSTLSDIKTTYGLGNLAGVGTAQPFATGTYYGQSNGYWYNYLVTATYTYEDGVSATGAVAVADLAASNATSVSRYLAGAKDENGNEIRETVENVVGYVTYYRNSGTDTQSAFTFTVGSGITGVTPYVNGNAGTKLSPSNGTYTLGTVSADTTLVLAAPVRLSAIDLALQGEILFTYKVFLPENAATIILTKPDPWNEGENITETYVVADLTTDGNGRYVVTMGIASGEMTRDITLEVKDAEGYSISIVRNSNGDLFDDDAAYSVLDYAELVFNGNDQGKKDMVAALLTYGGYAQAYFKVDADNPAYNTLSNYGIKIPSLADITKETVGSYVVTKEGNTNLGITAKSYNPNLDYTVSFQLGFELDEEENISDYSFRLKRPGEDSALEELGCEYDASKNRYYVDVKGIPSGYLDNDYIVYVYKEGATDPYIVKASVLAWSQIILNKDTATEVDENMAKALYLYSAAADVYFNKQ